MNTTNECKGPFKKYVTPEGDGGDQMGCDRGGEGVLQHAMSRLRNNCKKTLFIVINNLFGFD